MGRHILKGGEGDIFNIIIKKFCSVFCKSSLESTLWQFSDTKLLITVTLGTLYASSALYQGTFLVDTHYQEWNFIWVQEEWSDIT